MGLSVRDLAVEAEAEGFEYFDGGQLDLQFFDCADHAAGDPKCGVEDLRRLCGVECKSMTRQRESEEDLKRGSCGC